MLKRIAIIILAILLIYISLDRLGFETDIVPFLFISAVAYEVMGIKRITERFRPVALAIVVFFGIKLIFEVIGKFVPFDFRRFETDLLIFLISISTAWIRLERFQPFITSIGLLISAYFGFSLISKIPFEKSHEIGILLVIVLILIALTTILPVYKKLEFLVDWRGFIISAVIVIFVYCLFIRPILVNRPGLMNLFDWLIVLTVFLKSISKLRMEVVEVEVIGKHERLSDVKRDEIVDTIEKARMEFVERGNKSPIIAVLVKNLLDAGYGLDDIIKIITPIVRYEDRRIPKFAFYWEKEMMRRRNRERRETVLNEVLEMLERR